MNKLITIFLFEFLSTVRRRLYLIMVAAFPIGLLTLILIVRVVSAVQAEDEPGGPGKVRGYVDQWGRLPAELPAGQPLRPYGGEEDALSALLDKQIKSYFVVPSDYVRTGIVQEYSTRPRGIFDEKGVPGALRFLLVQALVANEVSPGIAARVQAPVLLEAVRLTQEGDIAPEERDELSRILMPYGFALLLGFSLIFTSQLLAQSVTEEKQSRTMEVLLSSVSPFTLMAGKILGLGAAGLLQILVWLISARLLFILADASLPLPADLTIDPVMLVLAAFFFVLAYLFIGTVVAGVSAMASSSQGGDQIASLVAMFGFMPPMLLMPVITNDPNGTLARVLTFIPFTSSLAVMVRLAAATTFWLDIVVAALLMALATLGALFLASRVFRASLLLRGTRTGLGEIWRALRVG